MIRTSIAVAGFFGIFFLSPLFVFACAVVLAIRYRASEVVFMGLLMDFAWMPSGGALHMIPLATLLAIFIVWAFEPLRSEFLNT